MKKKIIGGIALGLLSVFSLASCNLTITDNTKNQDQTDSGSDSDTKTESFTITFNSMGGSSVTSQTVKKGNKATKPIDPTRSGYTFAGWYKEEAYTNEFNFETTTITYDRTLYAKWTQNSSGGGESTTQYTVTFDANGHGTAPAAQTISKGGIVTKPTDPSATGYTFGGWYKESSCTNAWNFTTDTVNGATTLYAKWTPTSTPTTNYTVSFNTNGHGTAPANQTVAKGGKVTKPTDPSADNYTFGGWYKESGCINVWNFTSDTVNSTTTLYAKWTPTSSSGELTITNTVGYNEAIYFTFNPASGHTNSSDYTVLYKKSSETESSYTSIRSELVRINNGTGRADILGLTPSNYDIKIQSPYDTKEVKNIEVVAQDRSGYAHFGYTSGIGAYNNDGTLKSNAEVYYVTDENKNNVDGHGTSLAQLITTASNPLCIRIIGSVKTTQFNTISYNKSNVKKKALIDEQAASLGGNYNTYTAEQIIANEWNSYSNDLAAGITTLNGLTSKVKYSTSGVHCIDKDNPTSPNYYTQAFDTYWNMMEPTEKQNITIEGVGDDAEIYQWGFMFKRCNSIEVKNLTFTNYTEDACSVEGAGNSTCSQTGNYWIHNCTFNRGLNNWDMSDELDKNDGDGATDFRYCHNVTISYTRYNNTHKTGLVGSGSGNLQYNFTLHHNFYNLCEARLPYTRQSNIHMYNNYYLGNSSLASKQIFQIDNKAYVLLENSYIDGYTNPLKATDSGVMKAVGNNVSISGASNVTRATSVDSSCKPDGSTNYSNFDTNSSLFYYDATNQKSNVSIMNNASDLPTLIPNVAGAGLCAKLTY